MAVIRLEECQRCGRTLLRAEEILCGFCFLEECYEEDGLEDHHETCEEDFHEMCEEDCSGCCCGCHD